jgi:hypothetical protein
VEKVRIDDGDTLHIVWAVGEVEVVRILGIDTPETRHDDHDIPFDQSFGPEAAAFARGVFAMAEKIELLRASTRDPYGRTLGYVFVNGKNFSVVILAAGLAVETVSVFGDNGLPEEAAACRAAAVAAGPVPFESPHLYRLRMREVAKRMRAEGKVAPKAIGVGQGTVSRPAKATRRPKVGSCLWANTSHIGRAFSDKMTPAPFRERRRSPMLGGGFHEDPRSG